MGKTVQKNLGVDFGFNNGKISGTIDLYEKTMKIFYNKTQFLLPQVFNYLD